MKIILQRHLFSLIILLTWFSCQVAVAQTHRYVSPSGVDAGTCPVGSPCATINFAIAAADPGDVVHLSPGVYGQQVVIDKPLTLLGTGAGTNPAEHSIITGDIPVREGRGITLAAGVQNITIKDLRVQRFGTGSGIYGQGQNNNLTVQQVEVFYNTGSTSAEAGIHLNGPIQNVNLQDVNAQYNSTRGIVIWNGRKKNITITHCTVSHNSLAGVELQDGTATGVTVTDNFIEENKDSGLSLVGLSAGSGPNIISGNTIRNNGRFGMEVKLPEGTGLETGDGSILISGNLISRTVTIASSELRDLAGIAVYRRSWTPDNADIPQGVVIKQNIISGYRQPSNSDGFGIVIEGQNMVISGNTISDCDVATQLQGGHLPYAPGTTTDGDQSNLTDEYFGRGNAPAGTGTIIDNIFNQNTVDTRYVGVPAPDLNQITWSGTSSSDWGMAANWREELVPSASNDVLIPAGTPYAPVITSDQAVGDVLVAEGATLEVKNGKLAVSGNFNNNGTFVSSGTGSVAFTGETPQEFGSAETLLLENLVVGTAGLNLQGQVKVKNSLTLNGFLNTNGHSLTLSSHTNSPTIIQKNPAAQIVGSVTIERILPGLTKDKESTILLASPFANASMENIQIGQTIQGADGAGIYRYEESATAQKNIPYWVEATEGTKKLNPGQGFRVITKNSEVVSLSGTLQTGPVSISNIGRTNNPNSGWHLLGNPYPAPLDWEKVAKPNGLNEALYSLSSSGRYESYINGIGTTPEATLVPALHGFFVRVQEGNVNLNFNPDQTITTNSVVPKVVEERPVLYLKLNGSYSQPDVTAVYFEEGATAVAEAKYDAFKVPFQDINLPNLFTLAGPENLSINGLPLLKAGQEITVPLGATLPQTGNYTLEVAALANFEAGVKILLEDRETGKYINLREISTYGFTANNQNITSRFYLHFQHGEMANLSDKQNSFKKSKPLIYPNPIVKGNLNIDLADLEIGSGVEVTFYNSLGQPILRKRLKTDNGVISEEINVSNLKKGVYLLQLQTSNGTLQQRIVRE